MRDFVNKSHGHYEGSLRIRLRSEFPHVLGEAEPREERMYVLQILKDSKEMEWDGEVNGRKAKVGLGGLLIISGNSWEECFAGIARNLAMIRQITGKTAEDVFAVRDVSAEEYDAGMDGYEKGCRVGSDWAYKAEDFRIFADACRDPVARDPKLADGLSGQFARDTFMHLLADLGVDVGSYHRFKMAEDAAKTIAATFQVK